MGYIPKKFLSPLDAFDLFDEDQSHDMDEDEFVYAMEYLGVHLSDSSVETYFRQYDKGLSRILYEDFRDIFVKTCDVKEELLRRGADVPIFAKKSKLQQILTGVLMEEEEKELHAMNEARRYKAWMAAVRDMRLVTDRAKFRSDYELRRALDAAGQVR